jgi:hypothetical protein
MNSLHTIWVLAATVATVLLAGTVAAEPVTFSKDASLRAEPKFDAKPVAQIRKDTAGEQIGKQSPWVNVKTPQATGWALTTDLNYGSGGSSGGISLARTGTKVGGSSTLGARGFDEATVTAAMGDGGVINREQLALLDSYVASKSDGQAFASAKGLSASTVGY